MRRTSIFTTLFLAAVFSHPGVSAAVLLKYDFGEENPGNYNNVLWTAQDIADSIDFDSGLGTGISLTVTSATGFNEAGPNTAGTTTPVAPASDFFDADATRDSLFGHSDDFNVGSPRPLVEYTIAGLDTALAYDFTFFASRLGSNDNRETEYDVAGMSGGTAWLDPVGNTADVAQVLGVHPDSAGQVTLTIKAGPNNDNGSGFYYLGGMEIQAVPEPASLGLLGIGGLVILFVACRRRKD